MSKKQKRRTAPATSRSVPSAAPQTAAPSVPSQVRARSTVFEFKPDYTYIFKDLKRIVVLAGSFIAVLVVLSFFLR